MTYLSSTCAHYHLCKWSFKKTGETIFDDNKLHAWKISGDGYKYFVKI